MEDFDMAASYKRVCLMFVLCLAGVFGTLAHAAPISLLTNGDFEMGDFSGWRLTGSPDYNVVANSAGDGVAQNSGTYAAYLSQPDTPGSLSQSFATLAGHLYQIRFFLANQGAGETSVPIPAFKVFIDTTQLYALTDFTATDYLEHTLTFTAGPLSSAQALLNFVFQHQDTAWLLDDVTVADITKPNGDTPAQVPEPGTPALFAVALGLLALLGRKSASIKH